MKLAAYYYIYITIYSSPPSPFSIPLFFISIYVLICIVMSMSDIKCKIAHNCVYLGSMGYVRSKPIWLDFYCEDMILLTSNFRYIFLKLKLVRNHKIKIFRRATFNNK